MKTKIALFVAFGMLALAASVKAESYEVPQGVGNSLQTSDYGGVMYATSSASGNALQVFQGRGVFTGLAVSTAAIGVSGGFFKVCDTTSTVIATAQKAEVFRIYVGTNSLVTGVQIPPDGGWAAPPTPVRVKYGLVILPSSADYIQIAAFGQRYAK